MLDVIAILLGRKVISHVTHKIDLPNGGTSTVVTRRMETKTTKIIEITTTVITPKTIPAPR